MPQRLHQSLVVYAQVFEGSLRAAAKPVGSGMFTTVHKTGLGGPEIDCVKVEILVRPA